MAAATPGNQQGIQFEQIIQGILSTDNTIRAAAEEYFKRVKTQPDVCISQLMATLEQSQALDSRNLCAVLLRKCLTKDDPSLWDVCSPQVQGAVKMGLLKCISQEQNKSTLKKVCDTTAEIALDLVPKQAWPELLPFLFQCTQNSDPRMVEAGLLIFAQLAGSVMDALTPYIATLHGVLMHCLSSESPDVAVAAARATSSFIQALDDASQRDQFQTTIPAVLGAVAKVLNAGDESAAQEVLENLVEVAEAHPRFLRKQLAHVVTATLQIANADKLEASTRQLAAEFLITLCEAREKAPGMMRKLPNFLGAFFDCLMGFLMDIEDDPAWHMAEVEENETEGEGELYEVGQECLDRLALAVGGNTLAPLAGPKLGQLLVSPDWRCRHAALICLAQIAEGCSKVLTGQLRGLVDMCEKGLADPHAKVRWASCQALGQMCTDLGPKIQAAEHARILPALQRTMENFREPRVQSHAAAALVNFAEDCEEDTLLPYLAGLVPRLLQLLGNGQKLVQEGGLTALASVADSAKAAFAPFYIQVMVPLRSCLELASDKSQKMLRAKALECISLVGMAVGKDIFREDAHAVMRFMQLMQTQGMEPDDPTGAYMLQAGARVCKCLGPDFLPYMDLVMPQLVQTASQQPDVSVTPADEDDAEDDDDDDQPDVSVTPADEDDAKDDDDDDVETLYVGGSKISIRTSLLDDKANACNMLCCYADELKDGFFPWVEQVVKLMVPSLRFIYHEEVRSSAAQALPALLASCAAAAKLGRPGASATSAKQLLDFMLQPLLDAAAKEPDLALVATQIESLAEILELAVADNLLQPNQVSAVFQCFKGLLAGGKARRKDFDQRRQGEDFDDEDAEAMEDEIAEEVELLDQVTAGITVLMTKYGDDAMALLEELMPFFGELVDPSRPAAERRVGICVLDDIIEHSPAGAAEWMVHTVPLLLAAAGPGPAQVRQSAFYGLGVLAQKHAASFRPVSAQAVQALLSLVRPDANRSPEECSAADNAVAALGKVLEFRRDCVTDPALGQAWLDALPLQEDAAEAALAHAQLVRWVQANDPWILGQGNANLQKIAQVCVEVLAEGTDLCNEETVPAMAALLLKLQGSLSPQALQQLVTGLDAEQQATLQAALQGQPAKS